MSFKKVFELRNKKYAILLAGFLTCLAVSSIAIASNQYEYDMPPGSEAMLAGLGFLCLGGILVWFIIFILIGIWAYRDAEKRGKSGALWLIIVILLGLLGIIIWLIVRPPVGGEKKESDRRCPNCGRVIPVDAKTCPYCSKTFE